MAIKAFKENKFIINLLIVIVIVIILINANDFKKCARFVKALHNEYDKCPQLIIKKKVTKFYSIMAEFFIPILIKPEKGEKSEISIKSW